MTVGDAIREATERLAATSDTPRLDAEVLMAHALGVSRSDMLLRHMREPAQPAFQSLVERRVVSEPVAYITETQEFYGRSFRVTPDVLIPRGDSETLIEATLEIFAPPKVPARILDLGTGSGALLLTAMALWPEAEGVGIDTSLAALHIAQCNARRLNMADRARFLRRDWRRDGWRRDLEGFDLILCNPPYVEEGAELSPDVRDHEPKSALFAGPEGLDAYRILIPQLRHTLSPDGVAILEIGHQQADSVGEIAQAHDFAVHLRYDLAERPRALILS